MPDTTDHKEFIRLRNEITRLRDKLNRLTPPLEVMLRQRGFKVFRKEPPADLLIPSKKHLGGYYEYMKKYSFRLFLRDVIKHQPVFTIQQVSRYATREVTSEYVRYLISAGLLRQEAPGYRLRKGPVRSFGDTLEWFVAEIFRHEFRAEAIWGVRIKERRVGGDYDLMAKIEGSILCMEIKSSPPRQIYQSEIGAFMGRVLDLNPAIAVFFIDTELRMKDKICPMFEEELSRRYENPPEVRRLERELFEVCGNDWKGPELYIINSKDSIITNIERILCRHFGTA